MHRSSVLIGLAIFIWLPSIVLAQVERPTRPIPYPLTPSLEFQAAIANGSRTTTGEPGPNYWQQWTDYQLYVKLIPETKRIEGRARIVHHNRAPTPLQGLGFHLHQNVHAEGAI